MKYPLFFAGVCLLVFCGTAKAQGQGNVGGWQFDFHVDHLQKLDAPSGTGALPPANPPVSLPNQRQTRYVPSYYFGDGAALANQTIDQAPAGTPQSHIVPLDSVLTTPSALRGSGWGYGVRIGHTVTQHALVEFSADIGAAHTSLTSDARAQIETTRASYQSTLGALLTGPNVSNTMVTSTATINDNVGSQLITSAVVNLNPGTFDGVTPYFTIGAGTNLVRGAQPTVTLIGDYRVTLISSGAPIHETDTVQVTFKSDSAVVEILGGGVQVRVAHRYGIRGDVRVHIAELGGGTTVKVDANPVVQTDGTPKGLLPRASVPGINFSNIAGPSASQSTLAFGGGFETFNSTGHQHSVTASVGWFVRF
jgi:opacity protein-like surface antigen